MIEKSDVSQVKPPPKEFLIEWILRAQEIIESKDMIIKKSFLVAGITNTIGSSEEDLVRNDVAYKEIIHEVIGETHMGYVEPHSSSEDPFANCSDVSDSGDGPDSGMIEAENADPFATSSDEV